MADKVKIGIIGVGQIGKRHIQNYQGTPRSAKLPVEIVAAADVNETELKRVAEEYGIPDTYTDFRELLKRDDIVAVDVCLHNNFHAPVAIAAMEAGKNVYCEKPIAGSYVDGKAMVETAKKTGRMLSIQLATLFSTETKAAMRLIKDGYLGDIYYARSVGFRRRGRPYVDGYGTSSFVQKEIASGGAMYDMGVYHIAQMLYLLGNPPIQAVSGNTHQCIPMYEDRGECYNVEEFGLGMVRLPNNVTFMIEESWAMHAADGGGTSRLLGSKGGVQFSPFSYHTTIADMEMNGTFDLQSADTRWHSCFPNTDCYDGPQPHWVGALQNRVPLIDTAGIALTTMQISQGIYLSCKLGREVTAAEIDEHTKSTAIKL